MADKNFKPYTSVAEMKSELKGWTSSWGSYVSTRGIIYACERLDEIASLLRKKKPTKLDKPTAWQKFFSRGMRAGKSPTQIATEWRAKNPATGR